jgi:hypothetical protein
LNSRKKQARAPKALAKKAKNLHGFKAKLFNKKRRNEKIQLNKKIDMHNQQDKVKNVEVKEGAVPAYLLDREQQVRSKVLSNMIKQKRKEKVLKSLYHLKEANSSLIGCQVVRPDSQGSRDIGSRGVQGHCDW